MMMGHTVDMGNGGPTLNMLNSFGQFSEEPEFNSQPRQNLNMLKESMSKLSTDLKKGRMYVQSMIKNSNKRNHFQSMSRSPFVRSIDGFGSQDADKTLPSIQPGGYARNANIKSPVMESIRMSKINKSKQFATLQKYRDVESPNSNDNSDSDNSDISKVSHMRKSYITRKNNIKNMSANRGTFFVHKKETSAKPAERNQNIIRASTILNSSMMFGKKRNSKVSKVKASTNFDKDNDMSSTQNNFLRSKRKSKTFVEKEMFINKLATAQQVKRSKILNPCIESKESPEFSEMDEINANLLLSQKSIYMMQGKLFIS